MGQDLDKMGKRCLWLSPKYRDVAKRNCQQEGKFGIVGVVLLEMVPIRQCHLNSIQLYKVRIDELTSGLGCACDDGQRRFMLGIKRRLLVWMEGCKQISEKMLLDTCEYVFQCEEKMGSSRGPNERRPPWPRGLDVEKVERFCDMLAQCAEHDSKTVENEDFKRGLVVASAILNDLLERIAIYRQEVDYNSVGEANRDAVQLITQCGGTTTSC
jgi:hypothetical protein